MPRTNRVGELTTQLDSIRAELDQLEELETPTDEQAGRAVQLLADFDATNIQLRDARREAVRAAASNPAGREGGPTLWQRGGNPWDPNADTALRSRALGAVDRVEGCGDDVKERAHTALRAAKGRDADALAQWTVLTSDPAYERAAGRLLADPLNGHRSFDDDELRAFQAVENYRRAMSLTDAAGGFLAPFVLDPSIILTNTGAVNPLRTIARLETTTADTWNGVSSAGVTAEWLAESSEAADASPSFAQPSITPKKAAAWVQGSFEVLGDTNIGAQLGPLIADAFDRLEATAFTVGNGTTQPKGVITAVSAVGGSVVATTTADTYALADVYKTQNALPPRWRPGARWMAALEVINMTRRFAEGSTNAQTALVQDMGEGVPQRMLGWPLHENSQMDGTVDASQNNYLLLAGDFRQFCIVDRVGTTLVYEPLVKGANRRPTGEAGWFAYKRTGSDVLVPDAFRLLNA
jgi:HK97 family phage major capsid protein